MPRLSHDRDGWTYACPVCDGSPIYERVVDSGYNVKDPEKPYRCENTSCGATFIYVIERPVKQNTSGDKQSTLPGTETRPTQFVPGRELAAMRPEDVGLSPIGVRGAGD